MSLQTWKSLILSLLGLICLAQTNSQLAAQDAYAPQKVGKHVRGSYRAVGDPIIFVVAEFRGSFTKQNAHKTFYWAVQKNMSEGVTAAAKNQANGDSAGNQHRTLAHDRHLVVGWYNTRRKEHHFFAIKMKSRTECYYLRHDGLSGQSSGWLTPLTNSNGQNIRIMFADNDRGGAAWRFEFN